MIPAKILITITLTCLTIAGSVAQLIEFRNFYPENSNQVLWNQVLDLAESPDDNKADSLYRHTLKLLEDGIDPNGHLMVLNMLAEYYGRYSKNLEKAKEVLDVSRQYYQNVADTVSFAFSDYYKTRAQYFVYVRKDKERLHEFQKAYHILNTLDPAHPAMAVLHNDLMQANFAIRNIKDGFFHYDALLDDAQKNNNNFYRASAYLGAGNLMKFYNPDLAVKYFDHCLLLVEHYQINEFLADPFFYISIGSGQTATNQHQEALELYHKGMQLLKERDNPNMNLMSSFYYYIGVSHKNMGDNHNGIIYLDSALTLSREISGENSFNYMRTLNLKGLTLNNARRYDEALPINKAVMDYYIEHRGKQDVYYTQQGLREVSRSYHGLGRYEQALQLAQRGICYMLQLEESEDIYALPDIEHHITPEKNYMELEYNIYSKIDGLQEIYKSNGDEALLPIIMDHFDMVMKITDVHASLGQTPNTLYSLSSRYKYHANKLLSFAFEMELSDHYLMEVYQMVAKSKSYSFLAESLQNRNFKVDNTQIADDELNIKTELSERILSLNPENNTKEFQYVNEKLLVLEKDEFLSRIANPVATERVLVSSLAETREMDIFHNINPDEIIVDIYIDKQSLYTFIFTEDSFMATSQLIPEEFSENTQKFLRALRTGHSAELTRTSKLIGDALLGGIDLRDKKHLIIVPDENLHLIPFDLLPYKDGLLIESIALSTRYASHLYRKTESNLQVEGFLAFAPVFDDGQLSMVPDVLRGVEDHDEMEDIFRDHDNFVALPASALELHQISELFTNKGLDSQSYLRSQATKTNFRNFAHQAAILHIATHGYVDRINPDRSGMVLQQDHSSAEHCPGFLYMGEINNMEIQSDLVVLSACYTGYGSILRGEGVIGISRGFLAAGANNVIASLWKVHDEKTKDLMVAFYSYLLEGNSYADALRLAKLDGIERGYLPMDWAGFLLIGS